MNMAKEECRNWACTIGQLQIFIATSWTDDRIPVDTDSVGTVLYVTSQVDIDWVEVRDHGGQKTCITVLLLVQNTVPYRNHR